eukprot:CAMPEP_0202471506 /NCGR_PEP_ID=MMETSP1360-20130828/84911_1 /ASSEMBLY_ACC=CAM_ASM_000848 /TAXON_ID=515479 /ORGANISM="Licmophora paradoxa, Strain CCMP2313" /LENGTH=325 /DNA_ID=CAMNT_0049097633 /DNA_START=36 /DNA_END=1013 /DNA_ORIENTATION=+
MANSNTKATKEKDNGEVAVENENYDPKQKALDPPKTPALSIVILIVLIIISVSTIPRPFHPDGPPTSLHVWYYGWITAISTGFGVVPLLFTPHLDDYYVGVSNAVAAGMMIAASYSLFVEGCTFSEPTDSSDISSEARTAIGALLGLGFILGTKQFLEKYEDLKMGGLGGADARRALLIFCVMTLHSFSEGVGIGVSFGGAHGTELGLFISASLAVHNIPEGLAIAVVLIPKRTPKLTAALWAVMTSIPQPLMAVPAYWFVHSFIPILPVGLGFAGGAMAWVAFFELLLEAYEDTDILTTGITSTLSMTGMLFLQSAIDGGARSA